MATKKEQALQRRINALMRAYGKGTASPRGVKGPELVMEKISAPRSLNLTARHSATETGRRNNEAKKETGR